MIVIHFNFKHFREESDLEQLNALLNVMPLQDLCLENDEGYLCTARDGKGKLLSRRYGLDSGLLRCTLARRTPGYHYRIDIFTEDPAADHRERVRKWEKSHPGRSICYSIVEEFEKCDGYLIIHRSTEALKEPSQNENTRSHRLFPPARWKKEPGQ